MTSSSPTARKPPSPAKTNTLVSSSPSLTIDAGSIICISESSSTSTPGYLAMAALDARVQKRHSRQKQLAFFSAITNCLCAGSILLYSLYAPYFQKELGYNQIQINAVAIAGELGMYLPVPVFGSICDRSGPQTLSVLSSIFFGTGYLLASYVIAHNLPFWTLIVAWTLVGAGTSSMYFSGVTTCAKNFTGNSRGIALALPIAAFGLSSLWESQVVSRIFTDGDGELKIPEVFRFFAVILVCVGVFGGLALRVVPHDDEVVMESATRTTDVEHLSEERRPLLGSCSSDTARYGGALTNTEDDGYTASVTPSKKKATWLNEATMSFLRDKTMWWFAGGVFLVTGSGEAFINNMGTIIQTLYTPTTSFIPADPGTAPGTVPATPKNPISTATHVSIIALTSTLARLLAGSLSDYLAPAVPVEPPAAEPAEVTCSPISEFQPKRFTMSRMYLLLSSSVLMLFGLLFLASGAVENRGELFWIVSASIGAGYGAVFTLAPTIVSIVWGVENFGTNWGIVTMTPAAGATMYGLIFAKGYDEAAGRQHFRSSNGVMMVPTAFGSTGWMGRVVSESYSSTDAGACYGSECYDRAFYIMSASVALACALWVYAWRGSWGWTRRGVVV